MGIKRNIGLAGWKYQGGGPMLAFILHRISGLGIVLFVALHILASFLTQQYASDAGMVINKIYESWIFQIFIFFCALFHTINGLRIVLMDLWPKLLEHQREAIWIEWFIFLPIFSIAVYILVQTGLSA